MCASISVVHFNTRPSPLSAAPPLVFMSQILQQSPVTPNPATPSLDAPTKLIAETVAPPLAYDLVATEPLAHV